jgi:hypothetical protein
MKGMLKWPLIVAAVVIVVRVVLEQAGAPAALTNLLSVVALFLVICPVYFAVQIANSGAARPFRTLLMLVPAYAALVRLMLVPMYWLAYYFQWSSFRFSVQGGGNVGEGVTPLMAFIVIPLVQIAAWTVAAVVIGGGIGSIVLALKRRSVILQKV